MAAKLVYEMVTCSRCGGSGTYSYCQMYGSTCFKCGGRKRVLSKAGAKAAAAIAEFKKANFSVKVEDLKPGDWVVFDGVGRKVASVTLTGSTGSSTVDGVTKTYRYFELKVTKPVKGMFGPSDAINYPEGSPIVRGNVGPVWDAVVAFAKTIKKGVTVTEAVTA